MKIICVDNFNRETVSDRLVADNIKNSTEANLMIEALKGTCSVQGSHWYKLVQDDYKLYVFEP